MEQSIKKGFGTRVNGWVYTTDGIGVYGTAYKHRAFIALGGLGANPRTPSIPSPMWTGMANPSVAPNATSCTSTRASWRPPTPSY